MHLYRQDSPRRLILTTHGEEIRQGIPPKALVMQGDQIGGNQLAVEFTDKSEIDFSPLARVNARNILGCLGFINIEEGERCLWTTRDDQLDRPDRYLSCCGHRRD